MKWRHIALTFCLFSLQVPITMAAAELQLVLVASARSPIARLSPNEVRKLYLGIPFFVDGQTIKPLVNNSDEFLHEVFMQKTMFMSSKAYERQNLSRIFRLGGTRPLVYSDLDKLLVALKANPSTVSYMSASVARSNQDLKIISDLWQKQN
jgi:hypothetical protein